MGLCSSTNGDLKKTTPSETLGLALRNEVNQMFLNHGGPANLLTSHTHKKQRHGFQVQFENGWDFAELYENKIDGTLVVWDKKKKLYRIKGRS